MKNETDEQLERRLASLTEWSGASPNLWRQALSDSTHRTETGAARRPIINWRSRGFILSSAAVFVLLVGGYIGLATAETRRCNVALALDDPNRSALKPLQQLRERNGNAPIWSILAGSDARADAVEGAAGFPSRPVAYGKDNVLMIGDAAGYAEPFTGEGMALAMLSAALATRAICTSGDVQNTYQRLMRRVHAPALRRCRRLGRLLRCRCLEKLDARLPRGWDSWLPSLIEYVHVRSRR